MPTRRVARSLPSLALGMLAAIAVGRGVEAADSLKLAAGQEGKWDGAVAALGQLAGIFTRHGIELEILWTSGGGETMQAVISGSVDIGMNAGIQGVLGAFAKGAPVRIEALNKGDIRVIARSNDLAAIKGHTIRVNIANAQSLASKPDVHRRFMAAYRETFRWMYDSDEALKVYADFAGVSVDIARRIRAEFDPREMVDPDRIAGLDDLVQESIRFKYIAAPLTQAQLGELIQIPR